MGTQHNSITKAGASGHLLQCPACTAETLHLDNEQTQFVCQQCQQSYPLLTFGETHIPFLFSDVRIALQDWCARINGFNQKINAEIDRLHIAAKNKSFSKLTRERLKQSHKAKQQCQSQLQEHLSCFATLSGNEVFAHTELAKNQGIDSYSNNIFRDWCWENSENEELLACIASVVEADFNAGVSVTLGAGAGRLSCDFHQAYRAEHSVLVDINPVLLGCAKRILHGESIILNEFPLAPLTNEDVSVQHNVTCHEGYNCDDFTLLLADGLNAPLQSKAFDSVLTPWFIDIVPLDLKELIPHISRLLKIGGSWINTGSLAFFHHNNPQWNYSQEEVVDLLKKYGFGDVRWQRNKVNYLHSPYSAHGRVETVFSFSAVKKFDSIPAQKPHYLPEWVQNSNMPIPQQPEIVAVSSKYLLQAQVLSAIDGQRSMADIGELLAKQYDMPYEQAVAAVRQILIDNQ